MPTERRLTRRAGCPSFGLVAWRDRLVATLAALLVLACMQCVMTAGALPFWGGAELHVALRAGWTEPLAWTHDSLLRLEFAAALLGAVTVVLYAFGRHPPLRWSAIVLGIIIGLPCLMAGVPTWLFAETHTFLTRPQDGEGWEFAAFGVAGWWTLVWLLAGVSELVLPRVRPATSRPRGFEPVMTGERNRLRGAETESGRGETKTASGGQEPNR